MRYQVTLEANRKAHGIKTRVTEIGAHNNAGAIKKGRRYVKKTNRGKTWINQWRLARIDEIVITETIRTVASINPISGKLASSRYLRRIGTSF